MHIAVLAVPLESAPPQQLVPMISMPDTVIPVPPLILLPPPEPVRVMLLAPLTSRVLAML